MDLTGARWRTPSRGGNGECVEVGMRDSRDPTGPVLVFAPAVWRAFVTAARRPTP
ncbi:DUF397 domain-containing protein [Micromonospora sp. NPDC048935]|uniref:DUF397 domain-containing protein n=1 Tax=Micromonospora sp. NPDC048935 TaxID=3364262 RepID=UPI003710E961